MLDHDPILEAAGGTMRKLLASQAAPVSRLLAEVGSSFDLDAAQRADLADTFASEIHAEHIQNRLAAERARAPHGKSPDVARSLKAVGALSIAFAMATVMLALAASGALTSAKQLLAESLQASAVESLDPRP